MILVKRPLIVPLDPGPESGVDKEGVSGCCFRLRGRSTTRQHKHKHKYAAQAQAQAQAQQGSTSTSTSTQHKHKAARSLSTVTGGNSVGAVAIVQAGKQWPFVLSVTRWRTLAVVVDTCPRHGGTQRMAWPQVGTGRQTQRPHDRSRHSRNQRKLPEAETEMTNVRLNMSSSVALKPLIHQAIKSCGSIFRKEVN